MGPNSQFPADLVTFTEEILNGKLQFFEQCSESNSRIYRLFNDNIVLTSRKKSQELFNGNKT